MFLKANDNFFTLEQGFCNLVFEKKMIWFEVGAEYLASPIVALLYYSADFYLFYEIAPCPFVVNYVQVL